MCYDIELVVFDSFEAFLTESVDRQSCSNHVFAHLLELLELSTCVVRIARIGESCRSVALCVMQVGLYKSRAENADVNVVYANLLKLVACSAAQ